MSYFLNIFIFNFKRNFDIDYSKNDFLKEETFFKLILLYLRLYLEYEETFIFLSENNFFLLKSIMQNFINAIPHDEIHFKNNIQNIDLIFEIATKIFLRKNNLEDDSKMDIIKNCLLAQFNQTFLFNTSNFWKAFFKLKIKNEKGMDSLKVKTIKVIEIMVLYNFIISKDMDFSIDFITSCLTYNFNMKLIRRAVDDKIGDISYNFIYNSNLNKKKIKKIKIDKSEKFIKCIKLCLHGGFFTKEEFLDLLTVSKKVKQNLSKILVNYLLLNKSLNKAERKTLWFNYINFNPLIEEKTNENEIHKNGKEIKIEIENSILIKNEEENENEEEQIINKKEEENEKNEEKKENEKENIINKKEEKNEEKKIINKNKEEQEQKNNKNEEQNKKTLNSNSNSELSISTFRRSEYKDINEQIEVDIVRTKQWNGKLYQSKIRSVIRKFFFTSYKNFEYFQGFNYIVSFFYDFFQDEEETTKMINYISNSIIKEFFQDKLCEKLSLIHYQTNKMLEKIFPRLAIHWKFHDLYSEILFSSFFISLFTSMLSNGNDLIFEFWDVILVNSWRGVLECVFFIIDIYYDVLIGLNNNQTLRFFTQMKGNTDLYERAKKKNFKEFRKLLIFDKILFEDLAHKYFIIKKKLH